MTFAPTGPSMMVQIAGNQPQVVEIPYIDGDNPAIRLVAVTHPSSTAYGLVAVGNSDVVVTQNDGMPIDLTARKEVIIPLVNGPSHVAMMMNISAGLYSVFVTPGVTVA